MPQIPAYQIKAVSCFIGAHYLSFVRMRDINDSYWRMYNDDESEILPNWAEVLTKMLDMKTQPTILFYEMIDF